MTLRKIRVQARNLRPGDITLGTGETILQMSAGVRTPRGKIEVILEKDSHRRHSTWGAYTEINIQREEGTT